MTGRSGRATATRPDGLNATPPADTPSPEELVLENARLARELQLRTSQLNEAYTAVAQHEPQRAGDPLLCRVRARLALANR
jgi:hypothetical protein